MSRTINIAKLVGSMITMAEGSSTDYEKNIHYGISSPLDPVSGQLWVDTTNVNTHLLKAYNGNEWIDVGSTAEGGFNSFFGAFK
jgi:hypothetical protein